MKYFYLCLCIYCFHLYGTEEDSLYTISSLYNHIQQINDEESSGSQIPFDEEIDQLWQAGENSEYKSLLQQAKYYYDQADYREVSNHLDYLWGHLLAYPNFDKNPVIYKSMKAEIAPYLLPQNHPMKPVLDDIFSRSRITHSVETLKEAGFDILFIKDSSFIIVARHHRVPGYLFKMYLDSEIRTRLNKPSWKWLVDRCIGAKRIKKIIKQNKIKHFTVPDKWIYPLPPIPAQCIQHPVILLVQDMNLVKRAETIEAWKTQVTRKHLDELHAILSQGCGSNFLSSNVPYTKDGKFTFIDTEYPKRSITLSKVKIYIASELHAYWDEITKKAKK